MVDEKKYTRRTNASDYDKLFADKSQQKTAADYDALFDDVKKKATPGGDPSASPSPNGTSPSQGSAESAAGNAGQPAPVSLKGDGPAPLAAVPPQAAQGQGATDTDVPVGTTQTPTRSLAPDQSVPSAGVKPAEGDYFIGGDLGAALRAMDAASGLGLGKMTDGFTRAVVAGQTQNENVDEALSLLLMPKGRSDETLQAFIESTRVAQSMPPSKAMQEYERVYKEEGEDAWAFFKAIAQNPKVAPEVMIQSISSMFNKESMAAAGTVIGTAAAGGVLFGGAGAIPAAIGSLPYAMAAAGTVLETTASFTEFVQDELAKRGQTLTKDNLRTLLEDDDVMNTIRAKAAARGLVIGAVDGFASKLAGSVGAKFIRKAMPVRGTVAAAGIEAAGGSGGEAAARAVTGQPMDASQIGLEGIAEVVQAPVSILSAMNSDGIKVRMEEVKGLQDAKDKYAKVTGQPVYKINGEAVTKEAMMDIVRSSGLKELQGINFEVANDEVTSKTITDRMAELVMQEKVAQANPGLPPETAAQVTELEKEVAALKGNPTESAKVKVARAKQKIREIVEQPTDEAQQPSQPAPDQSDTERTPPDDPMKIDIKDIDIEANKEIYKLPETHVENEFSKYIDKESDNLLLKLRDSGIIKIKCY